MIDVPLLYGPHGLEAGGDEYVAEILQRTVGEQPTAVASFNDRVAGLQATGTLVSGDLSTLIATHAEWVTMVMWQMATCYVDAVVISCATDGSEFSATGYPAADALCDTATEWSHTATQARSLIANGSKVRITRALDLPSLTPSVQTLYGVWAIYDLVTRQVAGDSSFIMNNGSIPARLRPLYQELHKQVQVQVSMMSELRKNFGAAMIMQNKLDTLREARVPAEALFSLGQQLWAPFLLGPRYTEALQRPLALNELNLGFDPWILTDPEKRKVEERRPESQKELAEFWSAIADPSSLNSLAGQIATLRRQDSLRRRFGRGYPSAPWPSQFLVRRSVTLCGRTFAPGDLIAFFARPQGSQISVDVRKTGKLTKALDLLGHPLAE